MTADAFPPYPTARTGTISRSETTNLADILERVLDKGVVIAGDIVVNLVDVELLTIRLRLLIASVDKAKEMGINWWETDAWLTSGNGDGQRSPTAEVSARLERLEATVERMATALEQGRSGT